MAAAIAPTPERGAPMTTEHVTWTARCPWCGSDAVWRSTRNLEGTSQSTRIVCEQCQYDTDPSVSLAAVITNRGGAA